MSDKAPEELLGKLHGQIAQHMLTRIEEGDVSASELSVMVKFLKDNDMQCDPQAADDMEQLSMSLPDPDDLHSQHQ